LKEEMTKVGRREQTVKGGAMVLEKVNGTKKNKVKKTFSKKRRAREGR